MNSKQERQGNQSAASVSVPRRKGEWVRIRGNSNDTQHVLASSRLSYRPRYPAIRNAMRHASPIFVYSLSHLRLVFSSRSISSRRASRLYTSLLAHAVFVMSSRRVLLIGLYSLRLIILPSSTVSPSPHPHYSIYPSHPCILVFLYLLYTSHTSYSLLLLAWRLVLRLVLLRLVGERLVRGERFPVSYLLPYHLVSLPPLLFLIIDVIIEPRLIFIVSQHLPHQATQE